MSPSSFSCILSSNLWLSLASYSYSMVKQLELLSSMVVGSLSF
jgi:hypothetical protein